MSMFSNDKPPAHPAEKPSGQTQEELGLAGESVDFNSVLSTVSGNGTHDVPEKPATQKDLNLSKVIADIQDEGPATKEGKATPETQQPPKTPEATLPPDAHLPADSTTKTDKPTKPHQHPQPPSEKNHLQPQTQVTPADHVPAAKPAGGAGLEEPPVPVPWNNILMRVVATVLLVGLAGMGYLLYTQESNMQMRDAKIAQLNEELKKMAGQVAFLEQQQQTSNLVTVTQMQEQLDTQRQDINAWLQSELHSLQSSRPASSTEAVPNQQDNQPAAAKNTIPQAPIAKLEEAAATKPVSENRGEKTTAGKGGRNGSWVVHVASYRNQNQARKTLLQYATQIPDARIQTARVKGKEVFRISIPGFSSKQEALDYRKKIGEKMELKGVWIAREKNK
ncbi:SPOR domain-containing protein [Thiolapillus sp.]